MVAHVVLFRPRADLDEADRRAFAGAFQHAIAGIPSVRRARVGWRINLGREYDALNTHNFQFVAILEFDREKDLAAYLAHPAHQELGARFYQSAEAALVYDFELKEGADVAAVFDSRL